ncbi:MAG: hypothetical protein ACP5MK_00450 [Candidatus Micrarchaeia archaeon]
MEVSKLSYPEASKIIDSVSGGANEGVMVIKSDQIMSSMLDIKEIDYENALSVLGNVPTNEGERRIEVKKPSVTPPEGAGKEVANQEVEEAAKAITNIVGIATKKVEEDVTKEFTRIRKGKLLLPTLSLQDQINELTSISEGLDENVFDSWHMDIIRYEVSGLTEYVKYEKTKETDEFNKMLIKLRDSKLDEVNEKLKRYKANN